MTLELLRQVRILDPVSNSDTIADVLIADGIISAIAPQISPPDSARIRDCQGLILGTGLVDLYSHSGEPGYEDRETLASIAAAAIAGGVTRLHLLPDTQPVLDQRATVDYVQSLVQALAQSQPGNCPLVGFWGALTHNIQGEKMAEIAELAPRIVGFADPGPITNPVLLKHLLDYTLPLAKPIGLVPCLPRLAKLGSVREGDDAMRLGLPSIPAIAETAALAALLEIVTAIRAPVHVMGISTDRGVELIAEAKARGLAITASVPWMHLILSTQDLLSYDPSLHLEPPLGRPRDQQALRQAIGSGIIDSIAIDHQAYTYEEKTVAFSESPTGAIGLELALPLLWQTLVVAGTLTALELWRALSQRPAECLQQSPPQLVAGAVAECCLFDPQLQWQVNSTTLRSRSQNTPWWQQTLQGKVIQTWCPQPDIP